MAGSPRFARDDKGRKANVAMNPSMREFIRATTRIRTGTIGAERHWDVHDTQRNREMTDEEKFYADLGDIFVASRVRRGLTAADIARMTDIGEQRYRAIERGDAPTAHEFVRIWFAFGGK